MVSSQDNASELLISVNKTFDQSVFSLPALGFFDHEENQASCGQKFKPSNLKVRKLAAFAKTSEHIWLNSPYDPTREKVTLNYERPNKI